MFILGGFASFHIFQNWFLHTNMHTHTHTSCSLSLSLSHGAPPWSSWECVGPQINTTWVRISACVYLMCISSLSSVHYLWRSLVPFSLPCTQKWPWNINYHHTHTHTSLNWCILSVYPFILARNILMLLSAHALSIRVGAITGPSWSITITWKYHDYDYIHSECNWLRLHTLLQCI